MPLVPLIKASASDSFIIELNLSLFTALSFTFSCVFIYSREKKQQLSLLSIFTTEFLFVPDSLNLETSLDLYEQAAPKNTMTKVFFFFCLSTASCCESERAPPTYWSIHSKINTFFVTFFGNVMYQLYHFFKLKGQNR